MNLIEKLKENQFVVICIVCAIVIPITVSVTTWFYEKQKELILMDQKIDAKKTQFELYRCKNRVYDLTRRSKEL